MWTILSDPAAMRKRWEEKKKKIFCLNKTRLLVHSPNIARCLFNFDESSFHLIDEEQQRKCYI